MRVEVFHGRRLLRVHLEDLDLPDAVAASPDAGFGRADPTTFAALTSSGSR